MESALLLLKGGDLLIELCLTVSEKVKVTCVMF